MGDDSDVVLDEAHVDVGLLSIGGETAPPAAVAVHRVLRLQTQRASTGSGAAATGSGVAARGSHAQTPHVV